MTVARASEIPPERIGVYSVGDHDVAICNVGGEFFAICDICSHDHYYLSHGRIDGDEIECPGHAAVFNIRTGEVEVPPAEKPIKTYPCQVVDGEVQVGVDW